ncbi:hypothetical protein TNCV_3565441 [Trichonephila clavipes]|nr:hypothetical protein TNCV_3565441 [Trichonephila clavipes]
MIHKKRQLSRIILQSCDNFPYRNFPSDSDSQIRQGSGFRSPRFLRYSSARIEDIHHVLSEAARDVDFSFYPCR